MQLQPPEDVLTHTPIYRMVHLDCLSTILRRDALHAPSCVPKDGLPYTSIHAQQTQIDRGDTAVTCGPRGVIKDYIGFYLGPRSPMLLRLHTGRNVQQVNQGNIVYLVTTAQAVAKAGLGFVFSDRHTLAAVASMSDRLDNLSVVDFRIAYAERWNNTAENPDRQEKKQAEFLVYRMMPWSLVRLIGVYDEKAEHRVNGILDAFPDRHHPTVRRKSLWYYE